jgi:hypothetical protein
MRTGPLRLPSPFRILELSPGKRDSVNQIYSAPLPAKPNLQFPEVPSLRRSGKFHLGIDEVIGASSGLKYFGTLRTGRSQQTHGELFEALS